ncbi:right-handed parallel beta-helix repeat-containing protein [Clostridium saccharoperbutylacetonicum]|uniref:right-handed parallel beta-helix repeat-containing protein n=1 Tax=Clostridium saccharoperbutylacetonicum TaxID=36745 RepID=UPI000983C6F4|nr:right-handed parallel beta-helix repeat-containing protein [Clostridium saccharoperbutylacetonicum]AQR93592.1 fibronectin type III domain protein [Clostridium saccharoperbutylacetonicum]NSB29291.1 parallel beta-helix repeat protein [Clostridium saccharoperbutylacetonicum]
MSAKFRGISFILIFMFMSQWLIFDEVHATVGDSSWVTIDASVLSSASKDLNNYINYEITNNSKTQFYIKNGTYNLSDSIIINKPGIKIYGESNAGTILNQINAGAKTIAISEHDIEISNLYIDGSVGKEVIHAQNGLSVHDVLIKDCKIYGSNTNSAIAFYGLDDGNRSYGNSIQNNEIHSTVINSATKHEAISYYFQEGGIITGNDIYGSDLYAYHCYNLNLNNNSIQNSNEEPGIKVNLSADNITINNNNIKNTTEAGISIVVDSGVNTTYSGINVKNNTIDTTQYIGIEINNVSGGIISNNKVNKSHDVGINVSKSNNLVIEDNTLDNSQKGGIKVILSGNNVKVRNNTISNTHDSGIAVVGDSADNNTYTGIEVMNNSVDNTNYFGIEINNSDGGIITGNNISNIDYYGVYLLKSKNLIVENNRILNSYKNLSHPWAAGTEASIYLDSKVSNSSIGNNYLNNTNTCPSGILISNSTDNSNNIVNGNLVLGNFVQAINPPISDSNGNSIAYVKPSNLNATATDNSIRLSWDPVGSTTDTAIKYEVEIDGNSTWINVNNVTTYLHNGLNRGETHSYKVRVNNFGEYSYISQKTDDFLAPILTVGDYTEDSIEIRWNAETGQNYEVQVNGNTTTTVVGAINFYKKLGLSSDTTYKFKVRIVGQSQWSNEVTQKTKALIPVIVVPPTTPPAVITTPPAVITTPPAVVTTPSSATTKRKKKHKAFVEITVDEYKKILYKENLIYDYEEKKLKRIIEYSFKYQSHYYLKKIKDGKVIEDEEFKVDLVPEDLFSEQEIRNALIGKNDNIDTIIVRDFSNPPNSNEKNDLSQYSEEKESILTIKNNNTEVETIETYRKDIKNLER